MAEPEVTGQGQQFGEDGDRSDNNDQQDQQAEHSGEGPPKKRRRTAKPNADKKFECQHPGCGKSYSRAEHLYRHQLNHTPKNIYRCDFPDCHRYFVRQDLCVRHRERHTTQGSQLHKRDAFAQASNNQGKKPANISPAGSYEDAYDNPKTNNHLPNDDSNALASEQYISTDSALETPSNYHTDQRLSSASSSTPNNVIDPRFFPPTPRTNATTSGMLNHGSNNYGTSPQTPDQANQAMAWPRRRESISAMHTRHVNSQTISQSVPQSPIRTYSNSSGVAHPLPVLRTGSETYMTSHQRDSDFLPSTDMVNMNYPTAMRSPDLSRQSQDVFAAAVSHGLAGNNTDQYLYPHVNGSNPAIDMNNGFGYPIFGAEDYGRASPFTLNDNFANWLFNDNVTGHVSFSPDLLPITSYHDEMVLRQQWPIGTQDTNHAFPYQDSLPMSHPSSIPHILNSSHPASYIMSEEKRQELLDLMQMQFVERAHDAVKKRKDMIFEGNIDADDHILSLRMMHTYIGSYWYHQHAQLPILHKPTFEADKTPTLLLLAVVAIGAATLDKAYGTALTDSAAEFANFIVWHLRWEIIRDIDYRPPAKLWVFQTLLLIEVYEKMYSSRTLHERAHIHHDSTLTLMRRGSSLIGRCASESPPSLVEEKNGRVTTNGTSTLHDSSHRSDESWHRWITTEATRRAAFGAFVLDAIHCTMFGHSAKMVAHEMRLPLPCDEALWSPTSPAEVSRVQTSLRTNGVKPIGFLEGLKKTLNGQRVRTNSFGRTIIMAGLLSVSWHMAQRDLQIASIGPRAANSIGGPDKWKGTLLRAFDNWKRDFDEALAEAATAPLSTPRVVIANTQNSSVPLLRPVDDENIFESRTVLHHLAHIAAHVDIVDCQVFAGANRLLSRSVTPKDYSIIREKIEKWATRASARDSAFYALKFITTVLIPPTAGDDSIDNRIYGHASPILPQAYDSDRYIARDDFLLNRPWVLYISALVVWCYGFALEGPIQPAPREEDFATYEQRERDMRDYLDRVAGVRAPDDLENVTGKNRCLGLLLILKESFASTRWELTHEAAGLLGNAAMKLRGVGLGEDTIGKGLWKLNGNEHGGKGRKANTNGTSRHDFTEYGVGTVSAFNTARP